MYSSLNTSWHRLATGVLIALYLLITPFSIAQSVKPQDVRYVFKNTSPLNQLQYADQDIYIAAIGRSNTVGGGANVFLDNLNTTNPNLVLMSPAYNTLPGPDGNMYGDIFSKFSDLPIDGNGDRYIDIPPMFGAQIWIGLGSPMYVPLQNGSYAGVDVHNPSNPNADGRFEIIEFTQTDGDRIISNTTRVDMYQYPMGQEVFGPNGEYIKVGETATHEQVLAKYKLFVDEPFLATIDEEKGRIHQPTTVPEFQTGGAQANYFKNYIDQMWTTYSSRTLQARWGGVLHTATVQGNQLVWNTGERINKPTTSDIVGGTGQLNNGIGQILGVVLNRGVVDLNNTGVQVWDDVVNYYKTTPKNDYTHFFHSDLVSFESQTYAFAYDDVFDHSSTSTMDHATKVVISIGGFGIEHTQNLTSIYIDPQNTSIDEFQTFPFKVKGLDQGMLDMVLPSDAVITWSVVGDNSLIDQNGVFGPANTGTYTVNVQVVTGGKTYTATATITVNPEGTSGQVCVGQINAFADYRIETKGNKVYITFVPRSNFNGDGWINLYYARPSQGVSAHLVQLNKPYELYGIFKGTSLNFYYLYKTGAGQSQSPNLNIPNVGTCDGLTIEEYLTRIQIVEQNVALLEGEGITLTVIGKSNKGNNFPISDPIVWSGQGVDANGKFTATTPGTYTIRASVNGIVHQTTITVTSNTCKATVVINGDISVCDKGTIAYSLSGGTFTSQIWSGSASAFIGTDLTVASPTFAANGDGDFTLLVNVEDVNGCIGDTSITITVNPTPVSDISNNPPTICADAAPITLNTNFTGGVFSGNGVVTNTFSPTGMTNTTILTFNYTDPTTQCKAVEVEHEIEIVSTEAPVGTDVNAFSSDIPNQTSVPGICVTGTGIKWYAAPNKTGLNSTTTNCFASTFTDIDTDGFMDVDTYTMYATQTVNGCESDVTEISLLVTNKCTTPVAITGLGEVCEKDTIAIGLTGTFTSQKWSGTASAFIGTDLTLSSPTFTANGDGDFDLIVNVEDMNGCVGKATKTIKVNPIPVSDISNNPTQFCNYSNAIILTSNFSGGVFTGDGITNNQLTPSAVTNFNTPFTLRFNYSDPITTCVAEEVEIDLVVNKTAAPTGSDVTVFNQEITSQNDVPDICVAETTISWYNSPSLTNPLSTTTNCYGTPFTDLSPADGIMDEGVYTFYATQTANNCKSEALELRLIIEPCTLTASINYDLTPNLNFENDTLKLCNKGEVVVLKAQTNDATSIKSWLQLPSPTPLSESASANNFTPSTQGSYYVIVKDNNFPNQCFTSSDTIHLATITPLTPSSTLSIDKNDVCENELQTISSTSTNEGINPNYEWFINGVKQSESSSNLSSSTLKNGDQVQVYMASSIGCITDNEVSSNTIAIIKKPTLNPSAKVDGVLQICENDKLSLQLIETMDLGSTFKIDWVKNNASVSNTIQSGDIEIITGDVLLVTISDLPACSNKTTLTLLINYEIILPIKPSINQQFVELCEGETIRLFTAASDHDLSWFKDDVLIGVRNEITIGEEGLYQVKLEDGICPIQVSDMAEVVVYQKPKVDAGEDARVFLGKKHTFDATTTIPSKIEWITAAQIDNTQSLQATITPSESDFHILTATNGTCVSSDSIYIRVEIPFVIPNAFSPNNDQINDTWVIDGIEEYPNAHLTVFNRWGFIIYEVFNGVTNFWNGGEFPVGTYYYTLELKDSEAILANQTITGAITITR